MTADGNRLRYDKLLLTTGATPRRLPVPGADLAGVHYLRTLDDSDQLKAALRPGTRVVIIGGGWIGLETAAAARTAGAEVTVLEHAELPLLRVLGPQVAQVFADLHTDNGVDLRCGVTAAAIRPAGTDPTTAGGVQLADGTTLDADVIIVGIGVTPNVELARSCRLNVDNGILVDRHLRTSDDDICAAGDVANAYHPLLCRQLRVEHWANALHQPAVAAKTMLGKPATYDRLPYFFTDQYDLGMEYTGYTEPDGHDQVVIRGDLHAREFIAFWLRDQRVLAGMNVNIWDVTEPIQAAHPLRRTGRCRHTGRPRRPTGRARHNLSLRHEVHAHGQPEEIMAGNSFNARERLTVGELTYEVFRLDRVDGAARLPYSLKVLLENLLRNEDGALVTAEQVNALGALGSDGRERHRDSVHAGAGAAAGLHRGALRGGSGRDA